MHVLEHVVAPGLLAIMQQQLFCKLWVSARDLQFYMSRHCRTIRESLLRHICDLAQTHIDLEQGQRLKKIVCSNN